MRLDLLEAVPMSALFDGEALPQVLNLGEEDPDRVITRALDDLDEVSDWPLELPDGAIRVHAARPSITLAERKARAKRRNRRARAGGAGS